MFFDELNNYDSEVFAACGRELGRQKHNIELIASENIVSKAVLLAAGTVLTNKYAEGYPGKRYYGGCIYVDEVEEIARERAKKLFGAEHANVQPHSGANANLAVFFALLEPGDTVLSMNLAHGGHLSHGSPVNISGKYFNIVPYGVSDTTETIDYDEVRRLALECRPKMILAGASAYPRVIDFAKFREIADEVGAYFMVDMSHRRSCCRRRAPLSRSLCRRSNHHHAQDAARSARRYDPVPRGVRQANRQGRIPRHAGRSPHAYHRRKGSSAWRGTHR